MERLTKNYILGREPVLNITYTKMAFPKLRSYTWTCKFNPNSGELLDVTWVGGSGRWWLCLLDNSKSLWKIFFDILEAHNELGKFTKFGTSRPIFSWRNGWLKKVRADSAPPPALIGLLVKSAPFLSNLHLFFLAKKLSNLHLFWSNLHLFSQWC